MLKRYPIRVLKYLLFLLVFFIVLFGIMLLFNWSSWNAFLRVWTSNQAWVMILVFVGFPLIYPLISYTARDIRGNLDDKRNVLERALASSGYTITEDRPGRITAHTKGIKKVSLLFEDRLTITPEGNHYIRVEGLKKEVVKLESRMRMFMNV